MRTARRALTAIGGVLVGTLAALALGFQRRTVRSIPTVLQDTTREFAVEPAALIDVFVGLSTKARHRGLLSLEEDGPQLPAVRGDLLRSGLMEVIDGTPAEQLQQMLETLEATHQSTRREARALLNEGAHVSVEVGVLCGLVALVWAVRRGGGKDAVESVLWPATCGAAAASVFWQPASHQVRRLAEREALISRMVVTGLLAVQAGDHPRLVRVKLEALLPAGERRPPASSTAAADPAASPGVDRSAGTAAPTPVDSDAVAAAGQPASSDGVVGELPFEALPRLGDRDMSRLLRNIDPKELALALRGARPETMEAAFQGMSGRAAAALREDMEIMGPQRISAIHAAQRAVMRVVQRLVDAGEISSPA